MSRGCRVPTRILLRTGFGLVCRLAGHGDRIVILAQRARRRAWGITRRKSSGFDVRSKTAAVGPDVGIMKREQLSAMPKYPLVLLSCVWLGLRGTGPPACQPLAYFGVQGSQLSAQGTCPKGYHKQLACPANPMMIKAPCRQMWVGEPVAGNKVKPRENRWATPSMRPEA